MDRIGRVAKHVVPPGERFSPAGSSRRKDLDFFDRQVDVFQVKRVDAFAKSAQRVCIVRPLITRELRRVRRPRGNRGFTERMADFRKFAADSPETDSNQERRGNSVRRTTNIAR